LSYNEILHRIRRTSIADRLRQHGTEGMTTSIRDSREAVCVGKPTGAALNSEN